jgi:hypothetical protein
LRFFRTFFARKNTIFPKKLSQTQRKLEKFGKIEKKKIHFYSLKWLSLALKFVTRFSMAALISGVDRETEWRFSESRG